MSYRCEKCNKTVPHGVPAHRVTTKTEPFEHPFRKDANRDGSNDEGGHGTRIVREMTVCGGCVPAHV